jgi:hypothetical protein
MKYTIELSGEDINRIIVEDLQDAFKWNLDSEEENELLNAIEVMLQYYMKPSEYSEWFKIRGRDE